MSVTKTLATAKRVLKQLIHDKRTIGLILLAPLLLISLLRYVFDNKTQFSGIAPLLLGIFPLMIMFLVTSIATLRERTSGTLDRLMTEPISKADFIFGYAIAFAIVGLVQATLATFFIVGLFDVTIQGGVFALVLSAVAAAFLGSSLGLFVSTFARNEFQAVQLIIPILMPQILLCGLFVARDHMAKVMQWVADVFPITYSVDAMKQVSVHSGWTSDLTWDLVVVLGCGLLALLLGAISIRRHE